jgi:diguanylate cyclase (GGDEF)-like protein
VAGWAVWDLPPLLRAYVIGLITAGAAVAGWAAALTSWRARDALLFGLLAGFGVVAVECARWWAAKEPAGHIKEMYLAVGGWLPVAVFLPPVYSMGAPVLTFALLQARTRQTIVHRRVFSAAANGLALVCASAAFHALPDKVTSDGRAPQWLLAVAGCALLWSVLSQPLVLTAIRLRDPMVSIRQQLFSRPALANDACEIAAGLLIAGAVAGAGVALLIPALPVVAVLARSFRRTHLDTRRDPQTGLLLARAWDAEADVQVARAQRTGEPLAVGIIHVGLGGTPGYLARETALVAAADIIRAGLRPYDLTGQLGHQEIVCLLPDTTAGDAQQIADRLRVSLTGQPVVAGPGQQPVHLAVAIGIAATSNAAEVGLTGLLAAADAALYQAQQAGQSPVCLAPSSTAAEEPGPDACADDREDIAAARQSMGRQLRALRKRAGLSQEELADLIGFARGYLATVERGRSAGEDFWAACDRVLRAGGSLIAAHTRIQVKVAAAKRAGRIHAEAADPEMPGTLTASAVSLADSACPSCGADLSGVPVTAYIKGFHHPARQHPPV